MNDGSGQGENKLLIMCWKGFSVSSLSSLQVWVCTAEGCGKENIAVMTVEIIRLNQL